MTARPRPLVVAIVAITVGVAVALLTVRGARRCQLERYDCKPAIRFSWDRGPVAFPSQRCATRCR